MIRKIIFISFLLIRIGLGQVNSDSNLVAEVGKYKITETDFIIRYSDFLLSTGINDNMAVRQSTLNNMIYETLLENYDDNKKIFNDPEFKNELEWAKKQTILSFLKDREIYAKISVTEDELREAFLRVNQKVSARHLFA
ncbi:MAG: SurA N-terminal domain-containing protein, partial [Syntrophothermus sp.]